MKSNNSTTLAASLLAAALLMQGGVAQAQNHTLSISEVGESATPVIMYDGSPVTPDPASTLFKDNWTIELPAGFALNSGGEVFLAEPENPAQVNDILVGTSPRFVVWASDVAKSAGVAVTPTPDTILNAGTFTPSPGAPAQSFNLVLADLPGEQAPDAGSTSVLLGLGLLGLFGASRIRAVRC